MLPLNTEMMSFTVRRIRTSAFPLIIAFDRYIKLQLIQPTSLYVPDGAGHLSFWLQLVLRERRFRTKFRTSVTVIYCELYEGGNQFSKLPRLIHNYGHSSTHRSILLRLRSRFLSAPYAEYRPRFPNARGFVSPAYNHFHIHNE